MYVGWSIKLAKYVGEFCRTERLVRSDQVSRDRCGAGVGSISIILLRFGQKIVKFVQHLTRKTPLSGPRGRVDTDTLCLVIPVD